MALFDPSALPGDSPLAYSVPAAAQALSVTVPGWVDAFGASLTLTQDPAAAGGPAAQGLTASGLLTVGPLPASVLHNAGGTSTLSALYPPPPGLVAGPVVITAQFSLAGVPQPPLDLAGFLDAGGPLDLDLPDGPPLIAIGTGGVLVEAGATEWVHVLLSATMSGTGLSADLTPYPVEMAAALGAPQDADWRPASWLVRTGAPAGTYARLLVGPLGALPLAGGRYRVYVRLTCADPAYGQKVYIRRARSFLVVE